MSISEHLGEVGASRSISVVEIPLTRGKVALIDAVDVPLLRPFTWVAYSRRAGTSWYASAHVPGSGDVGKQVRMHQVLMPGVAMIDHKNGDGLDNRRENLRPCTPGQNSANMKPHRDRAGQFKGVFRVSRRWRATITRAGHTTHLGYFDDEADAALAYNAAALELFGEFARLNEVRGPKA